MDSELTKESLITYVKHFINLSYFVPSPMEEFCVVLCWSHRKTIE